MNIEPLLNAPMILKVHIATAVVAVIVGATQLISKKGTKFHFYRGWFWVVLMTIVAITAVFLPERHQSTYILTTTLTVWLVIGLPLGIWAIKRGNIMLHRAFMLGLYAGGLIIALAFTLTPGRLLYKIFF
ncbi:DUF2306 domain-containing protein [Pseudaquidulcibacter saccharophilus]|uniref:DUF2306 domain-containing protein n=1 Tax=Pseudaquidulcibacter saccharophilus TaxID=2831900 RepID=UPI001EFF3D07|nr:DUF2306 domain-containing protein [Pseudaquidulcibacter saccharophilus]